MKVIRDALYSVNVTRTAGLQSKDSLRPVLQSFRPAEGTAACPIGSALNLTLFLIIHIVLFLENLSIWQT